jgi:CHAT domain-containing protein
MTVNDTRDLRQALVLAWVTIILLRGTAGAAAEVKPEVRLREAQAAFDKAKELLGAGRYADGVPYGEQALALREAVHGDMHPEVARCLNLLGELHGRQVDMARAEPLFQRGLAIREATLGRDHPEVASSLTMLGELYWVQGAYSRAEPMFERALAIREAFLGKTHPDVAISLYDLAWLYMAQGLYGRAEPLLQRALELREAALGNAHPLVAELLNDLAVIYVRQGLYDRASPLSQRALAIREAAFGSDHPRVAESLHDLAALYLEQGVYDRAEPLFRRALAMRETVLGASHPDVAQSLVHLAALYLEQGLYSRAEPALRRALTIQEATLGDNHYTVAASLHSLAVLYTRQGLYSRAEPLFRRALAIRETVLGDSHPLVASVARDFALLRLAQHRLAEALPLFARAFAVSEGRLREEALDFSEVRLASFLQFLRSDEERLYTLLRAHPADAGVRRLALGAALLLKGRSVEELADISRTIYRSLGPRDREAFERLRGLRTQIARSSLDGLASLPSGGSPQRLMELATQADALEADLARRSAPLRALAALPAPDEIVERVAAALPQDGVLVEFIAYPDRPLVPKPGTSRAEAPTRLRYLAVVLFSDASTRAIDLGPAEPIDRAAVRLRNALANRDATFQSHAQALYRLAFRPLVPLLGDARRLFLSPEGQLALVPFAALHDGQQFLVESFDFTYLTSGKDLLPRSQETEPSASVVVLADPDFSAMLPVPAPAMAEASARVERSPSVERFFSTLRQGSAHRAWVPTPLPGTRKEAEAIQRLLPQARLFLGAEATKERLLRLETPGILHVATHGFFLGDAPTSTRSRAAGKFGALGEDALLAPPTDPLLRSGLLLAGASALTASPANAPPLPADSTLATALELAGLDLWGTQLVVLSACDTGRGDVRLGQGVFGLRRALVVAGAETVVMSLWKVDDETTSTLMEAYYRHLLAGQGRATALREAMRWLRATKPEPHYWAPFIAVGSDAPLRGVTPIPQAPRDSRPAGAR